MEMHPNVFFGGHAVEIAPPTGGKSHLMAHAASVGKSGGSSGGLPCKYTLKVIRSHAHAHLKTKAHWVLGCVPQPAPHEPEHTFYVGKKSTTNGFDRYWGFVIFGGRKHYGWVDHVHFHKVQGKSRRRLSTYAAYADSVRRLMVRAWRYRGTSHKIPVLAALPTVAEEITLYKNRDSSEPNPLVVKRPDHHPFYFAVRWASKGWILVAHGADHGWYFVKASYKTIRLNPTAKTKGRTTQVMKPADIASASPP